VNTVKESTVGNRRSRRVAGLAVALLLGAASLLVLYATSINRELLASLSIQDALASRTAVHDRLVGRSIPLTLFGRSASPDSATPESTEAHLLWIADPDLCPRCLTEGLASWNALGDDPALQRRLIVVGGGEVPAGARRALRGTAIVSVGKEELTAALGPLLPNTKILVDGSGIILLADSRSAGSECGWSFDAQVGALRGVLASHLVRNQT